jgi:hypothetical protein
MVWVCCQRQYIDWIADYGYNEPSNVWETLLRHDGIPFCTVSFNQSDDECGTAVDHANEPNQIIQNYFI